MKAIETDLQGLILIQPKVYRDKRGFFLETYKESHYKDLGISVNFSQDNHSYSRHGIIRGMHFQNDPAQDKLVRVASGRIYDVAVDVRPDSPTFGKWQGFYLDGHSHHQLYIPHGFAHGLCVVSEEAHVIYKVSGEYNPEGERSFRWDDPDVGIDWPVKNPTVSERDEQAVSFKELFLQS